MPAKRLAIDAVLPGVVDAAGQRPDLVFDQFDRPAGHRLGDGGANLGQFDPEGGDRRLDPAGALQRFDLAGDLEKMTFERGEIGPGWRCRRVDMVGASGGALRGGIGAARRCQVRSAVR